MLLRIKIGFIRTKYFFKRLFVGSENYSLLEQEEIYELEILRGQRIERTNKSITDTKDSLIKYGKDIGEECKKNKTKMLF